MPTVQRIGYAASSAARRLARASARILLRRRSANLRCIHVRGDTEPDQHVGCRGWPAGRRAPGTRLGRRALPPPRRGASPSACARHRAPSRPRRGARRTRRRAHDSVVELEGPLRADARARAGSLLETSDDRGGYGAATASDRRARRDAHRADRRESALGARIRERQRQRARRGRAGGRRGRRAGRGRERGRRGAGGGVRG